MHHYVKQALSGQTSASVACLTSHSKGHNTDATPAYDLLIQVTDFAQCSPACHPVLLRQTDLHLSRRCITLYHIEDGHHGPPGMDSSILVACLTVAQSIVRSVVSLFECPVWVLGTHQQMSLQPRYSTNRSNKPTQVGSQCIS